MKDFNVVVSHLTLSFQCTECGTRISEDVSVPVVNYEAETANGNMNSLEEDLTCPDCGAEYRVETHVNIYGGMVKVKSDEEDDIDITVEPKYDEE